MNQCYFNITNAFLIKIGNYNLIELQKTIFYPCAIGQFGHFGPAQREVLRKTLVIPPLML